MYTYISVLESVKSQTPPLHGFLPRLATLPLKLRGVFYRNSKVCGKSNSKPIYTHFPWLKTHDSLNKELVTKECCGT